MAAPGEAVARLGERAAQSAEDRGDSLSGDALDGDAAGNIWTRLSAAEFGVYEPAGRAGVSAGGGLPGFETAGFYGGGVATNLVVRHSFRLCSARLGAGASLRGKRAHFGVCWFERLYS